MHNFLNKSEKPSRSDKIILTSELLSGAILFASAIIAILLANSHFANFYKDAVSFDLLKHLSFFDNSSKYKVTTHWFINEVLMSFFFLLIGLELKKEIVSGELSSKKKLALPIICAIGGIAFPIILFVIFNYSNPENLRGFAITCATDIAFTYGIISIFRRFFTHSLRVFITALAIIDDIIAILIIAIFYTAKLDSITLIFTLSLYLIFYLLARSKIKNLPYSIAYYLFFGAILWFLFHRSGVNPTLSGTLLGLAIPGENTINNPSKIITEKLSKVVNFLILPLFAFANFGIEFANFSLQDLSKPIIIGSIFGLFFGKQFGVLSAAWLAIRFNFSHLPRGTNWQEFYCASIFTGIGFTMSLFIAKLAFVNQISELNDAKIGVLFGSIISITWGVILTNYLINIKKIV